MINNTRIFSFEGAFATILVLLLVNHRLDKYRNREREIGFGGRQEGKQLVPLMNRRPADCVKKDHD